MLGIAAGRESIRRLGRDHVHLRHRNADFLCQALNDLICTRKFLTRDRLCAIHRKRNLVRIEIRDEVHDGGQSQRQQHAVLASENTADEHQQQRERR